MRSPRSRVRRASRRPRLLRDDTGAALAEFTMIALLLVFLLFAVLQVALLFYVRTVVSSSAADGARFAGSAGVSPQEGAARASGLIADGLNGDVATQVPCTATEQRDPASGLATVDVRCVGHIRSVFLPIGALITIDVSSHVLEEQPP